MQGEVAVLDEHPLGDNVGSMAIGSHGRGPPVYGFGRYRLMGSQSVVIAPSHPVCRFRRKGLRAHTVGNGWRRVLKGLPSQEVNAKYSPTKAESVQSSKRVGAR